MPHNWTISRTRKKRKEKQRLKARQDTVEGLQDFNKFIRNQVTEEDKKGLIVVMQKILNKKSSIAIENDQKRIKNLYNALTNDGNSIFWSSQITENLIRKAKNSICEKDKVFFNMYDNWDKENKKNESLLEKPLFTTQLIEKRNNIDRSTLYSFDGSFQLLQAHIAHISFLVKSAVDPKFCLLFVDLFASKIYTFPMKTRNLLAKKIEQFYNDIKTKKKNGERMRLQTDQELKQWKIYDCNKKLNVDMLTTRLRGGKAFAAE